jgi:hypothetical protein
LEHAPRDPDHPAVFADLDPELGGNGGWEIAPLALSCSAVRSDEEHAPWEVWVRSPTARACDHHRRPGRRIRRREFITVLGGVVAWPLAGHAQPERVRRVGVFIGFSENDPLPQRMVSAFAHALGRFGWVEGKNIQIDYRYAAGNPTL